MAVASKGILVATGGPQSPRRGFDFATEHKLSTVLKPRFFDDFASSLKRGDLIFVEAHGSGEAPEYAFCVVVFNDATNGVLTRDMVFPKALP